MEHQIGIQIDGLVPQRLYGRLTGVQCRGMAHRAADVFEQLPAPDDGVCVGHGRRRCEQAHKHGKLHDIAGDVERVRRLVMRRTFRRRVEAASRRFVTLLREEIARHALFNVVGFAREQFERLILGFPPEAGDGAVVPAGVWTAGHVGPAANAEILLSGAMSHQIGKDRIVVNRLDQARAE